MPCKLVMQLYIGTNTLDMSLVDLAILKTTSLANDLFSNRFQDVVQRWGVLWGIHGTTNLYR